MERASSRSSSYSCQKDNCKAQSLSNCIPIVTHNGPLWQETEKFENLLCIFIFQQTKILNFGRLFILSTLMFSGLHDLPYWKPKLNTQPWPTRMQLPLGGHNFLVYFLPPPIHSSSNSMKNFVAMMLWKIMKLVFKSTVV